MAKNNNNDFFDELFGEGDSVNDDDIFGGSVNSNETNNEESATNHPQEKMNAEDNSNANDTNDANAVVKEEIADKKEEQKNDEQLVESETVEDSVPDIEDVKIVTDDNDDNSDNGNADDADNASDKVKDGDKSDGKSDDKPEDKSEDKPKRRRRRSKKAAAEKIDGSILGDMADLSDDIKEHEEFFDQLVISPSKEIFDAMKKITEMENAINVDSALDEANLKIMITKNVNLGKMLDSVAYAWHTAYDTLTNKETGLIKQVHDDAILKTEGTKEEKALAGEVAVANYTYKNGAKVNLYTWANSLRGVNYFLQRAQEFQKSTGISLTMLIKMND